MRHLVNIVACLWISVQVSVTYDVFEFGSSYKMLSNTIQFLEPGEMSEVCEGDSFMLQCPAGSYINVAPDADIQFGRSGVWETRTRCGAGQEERPVSQCSTVAARTQLLGSCEGKEVCGAHLYGYLRGRDPCPALERGGDKPRKYLTVRYSCTPENDAKPESTTAMTTSSSTTTSKYSSTLQTSSIMYEPRLAVETLETDLFGKLDSLDVINENVTDYVNEFFEQAINNIPSAGGQAAPQTSVLNMTERISQKLMDLLDDQDEINSLEFKTSQLTVKIVKKKFRPVSAEDLETKWESRDKFISLPDQEELITGEEEGEGRLEIMMAAYENMKTGMQSASDVISVSVNNDNDNVNLSKPVTFLLPHNGDRDVSCAFWSFNEDLWSREGCVTLCHNDTHTKCSCDHLTNFALIFNVHSEFIAEEGVHANQLKYITYIGFTISIFCMVLTIVMFMFLKGHSTDRDVIHVNLCLSLLTAEIIFMFGIDKTRNTALCSIISILLHYFFLSSFAWMFLEGFQIYELLVKVFESSKSSRIKHFILGYGAPLVIVIFSLSVDLVKIYKYNDTSDMCFDPLELSSYGTSNYCWLAVDNNFILSFIVPAVVVIISNIAMLIFAVHSMTVHKMKKDKAPNQDILLSYMKGVGVLMCLLGSTWIFGILLLAFNDLIIAYAFTILNSLQGVGIFVFQCLLNPQTRRILSRNLQRFKLNFCQKRSMKVKYQRTNTYEITDFSTTMNNVECKDENQSVL